MGAWSRFKRLFTTPKGGKHRAGPERKPFNPHDYVTPAAPTPSPTPTAPSPLAVIDPLAIAARHRVREIAQIRGADDSADLELLIQTVGGAGALAIIEERLESLRAFQRGHYDPGHPRFVDQVARLESLGAMRMRIAWFGRTSTYRVAEGLVEWFFYHAERTL